jgi:hypothetical protein
MPPVAHAPKPEAEAAAYFFMHAPTWVNRHVETYSFIGLRAARRRLTIDLILPDADLAIDRDGDQLVYFLPLARMSKSVPLPFIDLHDEQGAAVPLRTRSENAKTSFEALEFAIRQAAEPAGLHETTPYMIDMLVYGQRPDSDTAASWLLHELDRLKITDSQLRKRLEQIVTHLILNSVLWVVVRGIPGEHRVFKLAADIEFDSKRFPARKNADIPTNDRGIPKPPIETRRVSITETLQIVRAWLASRAGWDAVDITIRDPAIQDPRSYHLQIVPGHGLRVERIVFQPDVEEERPALKPVVKRGHLYLRDPNLSINRTVPISVAVRVARRGFLNLSLVTVSLITALLWCYQASGKFILVAADHGTLAGTTLLIVPPFLVLMAGRSDDSALIAALLSGVRSAAIVCMVCAAASAAAIADIRPTHTLSSSLIGYATVSSIATSVIAIAWISTFLRVRQAAHVARCWWCGESDRRRWSFVIVSILTAAWAIVAWRAQNAVARHPAPAVGGVVALAAMTVVSSFWPQGSAKGWPRRVSTHWPKGKQTPIGAQILGVISGAAAAVWATAVLIERHVHPPHEIAANSSLLVASGIVALGLATAFALQLAPIQHFDELVEQELS